ncbi:voltage-gated ion channel superfamily [Chrysochromulina tobinii]|uniref:SAGA-associated factor 11 n=1 Tax=Chrysochromulina tobinii TaxID=1460289 RepID=A0A0M0J7E6_9EUKA|nr:voltage-gated ion channel superfamily [Chrysochromulina tobinii]|eukprot:KOO22153.1 voltage-gated ion channel superfamily [Chrysochromulina sp. CCMP291]
MLSNDTLNQMRLVKLVRLVKASRILKRWWTSFALDFSTLTVVTCILGYLYFGHLLACFLVLGGSLAETPLDTWKGSKKFCVQTDDPHDVNNEFFQPYKTWVLMPPPSNPDIAHLTDVWCVGPYELWVMTFYWMIMLISGAAGGDTDAIYMNPSESMLFMFCTIVACLINSVIIASLCDVLSNMNPEGVAFRNSMDQLNRYCRKHKLAQPTRIKLREYLYRSEHVQVCKSQQALMMLLSQKLQGELSLQVNGPWLMTIPFLRGIETACSVLISLKLESMVFVPTELLPADAMYHVSKGTVIYRGPVLLGGSVFGDDCILQRISLRSLPARALTYVDVTRVTCENLLSIVYDRIDGSSGASATFKYPLAADKGWNVWESLYFLMGAAATVGYGDLYPDPSVQGSRAFTVVYIIFGVGVVFAQLSALIARCIQPLYSWSRNAMERCFPQKGIDIDGDGIADFKVPRKPLFYYSKNLAAPFVMIMSIQGAFAAVFCEIEGWDFGSACYHCFVTITTVGFGDVKINTDGGRMWALFHILFSVSILTATLGDVSELHEAREAALRRMKMIKGAADVGLMLSLDKDGNGVDKFEFVTGMLIMLDGVSQQDIDLFSKLFEKLDIDGSGLIDADDITALDPARKIASRRPSDNFDHKASCPEGAFDAVEDAFDADLAKEVAEEALLVAGGVVTCSEEVKALLEGARGTLPNGDEKVSKPLFALLSEEAAKISAERSAAQKALAPGAAAGPGADVFGNRLTKQAAAAETIICTNCGTSLTANRYAPHLERCMLGKGRASARQARDAMRAKEVPLQSAL